MGVELAAFLGVATLVIVTPGPDMALVTRTALAEGMRPALRTSAGICCGLLAWGALSALGVAAVVAASATAFTVLKLAGAAYLVYLGVQTIRGQRTRNGTDPSFARGSFRSGLVSNLLNPKIAVFYSTVLPGFVAAGAEVLPAVLLLTGVHVSMSVIWLGGYAWAVTRAGDVLRRPRARRLLERVTGGVLVAFGARLALTSR
jgi:threonine/homoserine/homoserine lactone efflux protein